METKKTTEEKHTTKTTTTTTTPAKGESQKVKVAKETPRLEENLQRRARIKERRATKIITPGDPHLQKLTQKQRKKIRTYTKWWKKESVKYGFFHPHVRAKLEKLIASNIVSITDRDYMQHLQKRIAEEWAESQDKRIQLREEDEMTRMKRLVLSGIIPLSEAPSIMDNHPVMIIENICRKIIDERRAKIKYFKPKITGEMYKDDSPDLPSGLTILFGHKFRKENETLCHALDCILNIDDDDDVYMYKLDEYERLKYESPGLFDLKILTQIKALYTLADELVGYLEPFDKTPYYTRPSIIGKQIGASASVEHNQQKHHTGAMKAAERLLTLNLT